MDHYQCLGGWSWAMGPYYNEDLSGGVASDFMDNYAYLVDPYGMGLDYFPHGHSPTLLPHSFGRFSLMVFSSPILSPNKCNI